MRAATGGGFFTVAMTIERYDEPEGLRLMVGGDVDMTTGGRLERALQDAEASGAQTIVLDLSTVDFFDSTGLQILLDADLRARDEGRTLVVAAGDGEAARVLALAEVTDRLNVAV